MMADRCFRDGCRAPIYLHTYDGPIVCEAGHYLSQTSKKSRRFLKRATAGVEA